MATTRDAEIASGAVDLLVEAVALLREIRDLLARPTTRAPLTRADRALLARLLPAIVGAFGSEPFASRDLCTEPGPRVVVAGWHVKHVGRLLARAEGVPLDELVVQRAGIAVSTQLWQVLKHSR